MKNNETLILALGLNAQNIVNLTYKDNPDINFLGLDYEKQVINTKYSVNYKINGKWTGWTKYGTTSTAHHRYMVYDSAKVGQVKVRVHK